MNKFTRLTHDWTLIDDGVFRNIDAHNYRVVSPEWSITFSLSETEEGTYLEEYTRRAGEMLVDEILQDPFVKEAVDDMVNRARTEGYLEACKEIRAGERG